MDIKKWFEDGTGLKIKELRYLAPTSLPFNIFVDDEVYTGSDLRNNLVEHNIVIEHYSENVNDEDEKLIEDFLNKEQKKFDKEREWLNDEKMFITVYTLHPFLEKIRKESEENGEKNY